MPKRTLMVLTALFFLCPLGGALAHEDLRKHPNCKYCGMDREKFAHSRMLLVYDDGTSVGTCSIHCVAVDLALNVDKMPRSIQVGDYNSKKLVDAEKAYWVIGGSKPGVMTKKAKWAFERKEDAEKFIQENSGTLGTFDDAMRATYESIYEDIKMIRERKKTMQGHGKGHHP